MLVVLAAIYLPIATKKENILREAKIGYKIYQGLEKWTKSHTLIYVLKKALKVNKILLPQRIIC